MSARTYLTPKKVVEVYRRLLDLNPERQVSMQELADCLQIQDVVNPRTASAPTRQGVHYALKRSEAGRALLKENANRGAA